MIDGIAVEVVEERLAGLRRWLDERFRRIEDQLEGNQEIREQVDDHEKRLVRLERIAWLSAGMAGMLSPVVVWAIIEILKAISER